MGSKPNWLAPNKPMTRNEAEGFVRAILEGRLAPDGVVIHKRFPTRIRKGILDDRSAEHELDSSFPGSDRGWRCN